MGLNEEESKQLPGTSVTSIVALTVFSGGITFPLGLHLAFVWTWLERGIIKRTTKRFNFSGIRENESSLPMTIYILLLKHDPEALCKAPEELAASESGPDF